jgi:hypothetical protein
VPCSSSAPRNVAKLSADGMQTPSKKINKQI